jgi:hypothetical protein
MRQAVAVVTPSTKDIAERDPAKKSVLGAIKASSGESVAGLLRAEPKKDVDTSRADRIGIREGARESLAGQEIARMTQAASGAAGAGTGGGGAGSLGAASAPGSGGYESTASMRSYGGKAAYKSMKAERVPSAPLARDAPSATAREENAPPSAPADTKERRAAGTAREGADANQSAARPAVADDAQGAAQRAVNARNYVAAQRVLVPRYGKTPREPLVALLLAETHIALKQWKDAAAVLEPLLDRITEGPHVDRVLGLLEKVYEAEKADEKLKAVRAKRSSRSR